MEQNSYNVIGVMSGTSLDGVDCAYVKIDKTSSYSAKIIHAQTYPYTKEWKCRLSKAHELSKQEIDKLNYEYTAYLSSIIRSFIKQYDIASVDIISSHGHTILHQPADGITLQIGNLPELATRLQHKVVCDFRVQDVRLGGQGAPLVPIGDQLLFPDYDYCLNLGGFANISTQKGVDRIAYDVSPVNVVLNTYAQLLGKAYDDGGAFAKAGVVHEDLLKHLNALPFYKASAPKSLGIEWVHQNIFPLLERSGLTPKDTLATVTEHIAIQLARQFPDNARILVTGGGAYNQFLLARIKAHATIDLIIPNEALLEFKEALIFAFLGVLRIRNEINVLASVTGASVNHCSGVVYEI